ncbi:MAG: peptide ABC transporter substrate-binding protein, partial [Dehalococcoidia bacterium]
PGGRHRWRETKPVSDIHQWWEEPEQLRSFEQRIRGLNLPRRQFLKIMAAAGGAAAVAACGGGGTNNNNSNSSKSTSSSQATTAAAPSGAAAPATAASGGNTALAATQIFTYPSLNAQYASSHDFNADLYCGGDARIFSGLAYLDENYNVVPEMALKWDVSADGSSYTFTMRDAKWSNGDPVTANDFEWSFKRQLDPATAAPYANLFFDIKGAQDYNTKKTTDPNTVAVKAIDAKTLKIDLVGSRGYFPILIGYTAAQPAHRPSVEKFGKDKWTDPGAVGGPVVSNGPFVLTSWEHNKGWTVEKNSTYYNASKIKLTKSTRTVLDPAQYLVTYQNNQLDFNPQVQLGDLKRVQADPNLSKQMLTYSEVGTWYLVPSVKIPPFDDIKVRAAVAHAIDRNTLVKDVLQGSLGKPALTFDPPGEPGYNPNTYDQYTKFDPQMAKDMLKGTKYEGGKNWPKITMNQRTEGDAQKAVGDAIIQMLKDTLGMDIDHVIEPQAVIYAKMWKGEVQLMWLRWYMDYPDPANNQYQVFYGKQTTSHRQVWQNDQYDTLVVQANAESDPKKRADLYQQCDEIIAKDYAATFVYYGFRAALLKPWVQGLPKNKAGDPVPDFNIYGRMSDSLSIAQHS